MKTTDSRDPLDHKIDALLSSRPVQPSDDFTRRVLQAAQAEAPASSKAGKLAPVLRFMLPATAIAAAIAIAFIIVPLFQQPESKPAANIASAPITTEITPTPKIAIASTPSTTVETEPLLDEIEAQEIFLLEEGLSGLAAQLEENSDFNGDALLQTLDALIYEIES